MEEHTNYVKLKNDVNNGLFEEKAESVSHCEMDTGRPKTCCNDYFESWFSNFCKNKFDGRKTSLSNILLTIVMEEEKTERDKRVAHLLKVRSEKKEQQNPHMEMILSYNV
jgi:hypothetical protein